MNDNLLANRDDLIEDVTLGKYISSLKNDLKDSVTHFAANYDPVHVLQKAKNEVKSLKDHQKIDPDNNFFKTLTMYEFDKGLLATSAIVEMYQTFFVDFTRSLQEEYLCRTPSEKAICQLAALSYVRMLEAQRRLNNVLESNHCDKVVTTFISVMSKEIDRAVRHYFTALQTLQLIKQPALNVNIKTQTAVVGQNQIVQADNKC